MNTADMRAVPGAAVHAPLVRNAQPRGLMPTGRTPVTWMTCQALGRVMLRGNCRGRPGVADDPGSRGAGDAAHAHEATRFARSSADAVPHVLRLRPWAHTTGDLRCVHRMSGQ